ncbi:MAG: GGDEF domain-containing protein, partial [Clostridium sp.]|nr:GGDEF domain-containing protein [Clostridium sp.]
IFDSMSRFDGEPFAIFSPINQIGNFSIFFSSSIFTSLWLGYVHFQIFEDADRTKKLFVPVAFLNLLNIALLLISQSKGWYYYIDGNNIYHRGPYYLVSFSITLALLIVSSLLTLIYRNEIKQKKYYSLIFFIFPPLISMGLQYFFYGISLILHGIMISMLVLFLNIQNKDLSLDYLTQIFNRKKIDSYLKKKIVEANKGKKFAAMILDINHFKIINDQYGHDEGDRALQTVANLLRELVGSSGFVGRFGGDEFYVILDQDRKIQVDEMATKIKQGMIQFNKTSAKKYELELSIGYAVYDYKESLSLEEFQKKIDGLMNVDKELKRVL